MLRGIWTQIVRRRLWPVVVIALAVAVAAPLLFLKPTPPPASVAATPAPAAGALPARAQRLVAAADGAAAARRRRTGRAADPFRPPAGHGAARAATATKKAAEPAATSTAPAAPADPVPVVITNADGSQPATATTPAAQQPATVGEATTAQAASAMAVDVRWSRRLPGHVYRGVERLRPLKGGGRVVAIFVKYSPRRDKAVFAIAPRTLVSGDVECRRKEGVCRYVDIPAGKHARLTTLARDGSLVSLRLEVLRIESRPVVAAAAAVAGDARDGSCLLGKLLALTAADPPPLVDACRP